MSGKQVRSAQGDPAWPLIACLISVVLFLSVASTFSTDTSAQARPLNDTGITTFANDTSNSLTSEPATHPRQDASQGRDAAARAGTLTKIGSGKAGFDFTKIANNGSVLPASAALGTDATDWGCTYDNVTGLLWEVKTSESSHLRYVGWTYSWYHSNDATDGGNAGSASGGSCLTAGRCDTEKYMADVNAAGMCGHADWRLPTIKELQSIVDYSVPTPGPTIDAGLFPNTPAYGQYQFDSSRFWSGSSAPNLLYSGYAWRVDFGHGNVDWSGAKSSAFSVRLVRAGQ